MLSFDNEIIKTLPAKIKIILIKEWLIFCLYIDWKFDWTWINDPDIRKRRLLKTAWITIWKSEIKVNAKYIAKNI